jgi:4-amino-4-deoxy-L-arabinose transferase-like glycosyltransferase
MPLQQSQGQELGKGWLVSDWLVLSSLLIIGGTFRLVGLGELGLQVDEGIQALAVKGWLADAAPVLPSGWVYQRSIPFGLLQAGAARLMGLTEFVLRLPAAVFGIAAIAATYGLARGMFDRRVAVLAATFIAVSAWEIELSRYGRFYTAFQFAFVASFLCLYRLLTGGGRRWLAGFVASSLVALVMHELAIVIATCFLIPLFDRQSTPRIRVQALAGAALYAAVWYAYRRLSVGWIQSLAPPHGLLPVSSGEAVAGSASTIPYLPGVPLPDVSGVLSALGDFAPGIVLVLLVTLAAIWMSLAKAGLREGLLLAVAAICGPFHLFTVALLALLAWWLLFGASVRDLASPRVRPLLLGLGVSLGYWALAMPGDGWRELALALFGFPNVLQHFVYWFAVGWPVFLAVSAITTVAMIADYFRTKQPALLYLQGGIIIPVVITSLFATYQESRYVFHLYPLLVVAFAWAIVRGAELATARFPVQRNLALAAVAAVAFLASGDVGRSTLAPLTRTYGEPRDAMRGVISWRAFGFHQDQEGAAQYVREHMQPGDRVVAVGLPHQLHVYRYYVGQLDGAVTRAVNTDYQRLKDGHLVDRATGARLVFDVDELATPGGPVTWLIGDTVLHAEDVSYFPRAVRDRARALSANPDFIGRDRVTYVVRLP